MRSKDLRKAIRLGVGAVWIFHGLYSKILRGVPRHRSIVARVVGDDLATPATTAVGVLEILLGLWVWSGRKKRACAFTQTMALGSMNALEISKAKDLLISAPGMLALNSALLFLAWFSARDRPRDQA